MENKPDPLKEKSFLFALKIIGVYKSLCEERKEFVMSKQLLRSGTSIGANIREAQNAQSKADLLKILKSSILTTKRNLHQ